MFIMQCSTFQISRTPARYCIMSVRICRLLVLVIANVVIANLVIANIGFSAAQAEEFQPEARSLYVEGYTDQLSYQPGDKIEFHISTTAPTWSMEISRLGATSEKVLDQNELPAAAHPVPANASSHGCRWPVAHSL